MPSCRSNLWNLSPVQTVGLVTNSSAWKRKRRGLIGKLYAEAAARHSLDVKAISSSNTSSLVAREGKQKGRARDSWVRTEPLSRGKTFLSHPRSKATKVRSMPRKRPKLVALVRRIAVVRRIIDQQQALLERLRLGGQPTVEAEGMLRTYANSLTHLLDHERRMREDAQAKRVKRKRSRQVS